MKRALIAASALCAVWAGDSAWAQQSQARAQAEAQQPAAQQPAAEARPSASATPTRQDERFLAYSTNTCSNSAFQPEQRATESGLPQVLLSNLGLGVYDTLTAALDEAGKDKERVSTAVLNIETTAPICFQIAINSDNWRNHRLAPYTDSGPIAQADVMKFPFFAEFRVFQTANGNAISIAPTQVRYMEPIWRRFESTAGDLVATLEFTRPGRSEVQRVSVPLGGSTSRIAPPEGTRRAGPQSRGGIRMFNLHGGPRTEWFASPFAPVDGVADRNAQPAQGQQAQQQRAQPQAQQNQGRGNDIVVPGGGNQNANGRNREPEAMLPVSISIQIREIKPGNPVAAMLGTVLRTSRPAAVTAMDPSQRATAETTRMTANIANINAYGTALNNYYTAQATYCQGARTTADLRNRNPAPLMTAQSVLMEYVRRGYGDAPPYPLLVQGNPDISVCPAS